MLVQVPDQVDRLGVDRVLTCRIHIQRLAHAVVAEILEQDQTCIGVPRQNLGRGETMLVEMVRHREERPRILVRRRGIHQHGIAVGSQDTEIAAKGGIARERRDHRPAPSGTFEEFRRACRWNHVWRGHRPSHALGLVQVKRRPPDGSGARVSRSASSHNRSPIRSGHSISKALS